MKRILSIILVFLLLFSLSMTALAAEENKTGDVYAKYEENTEGIYRLDIRDGSATVIADGVSISVSNIPNTAKSIEIFPIPTSESEALEWISGKVSEYGKLSHAYMISLIDASGNNTTTNGVNVTISCSHCNGDEIVIGLNTDGAAAPLDTHNGSFTANGNTYYIVAEKSQPSGITVPVRGEDN